MRSFINKFQRDLEATEYGWNMTSPDPKEGIKIRWIKLCPVIGFGYWKEIYNPPFKGYTHNIILPFLHIQ